MIRWLITGLFVATAVLAISASPLFRLAPAPTAAPTFIAPATSSPRP